MSGVDGPFDRAAEADAARRDVLRTLRHRLRTTIDHIAGYTQLLLQEVETGEQAGFAVDLRRILQSASEVLGVVDEIFAEDKVAAGAIDAARVSRDVRTPLTAIIGYGDLLREEAADLGAEHLLADLDKIRAAGVRVLGLVDWAIDADGSEVNGFGEEQPTATARPARAAPSAVPPARGSLLVVDDNALNRDLLSRFLKRLGYDVAVAEDGRQALAMLTEQAFDLLLLDILMPGLDGFQVLARLKEDAALRDLPVIVLSALDATEDVVACIGLGADDYLTKPFNPVVLRARIGACLEKKRLRDRETDYLRQAARVTGAAVIGQLLTTADDGSLVVDGDEADVRAAVEREVERVSLPKGGVLFREGEPGDSLYVVLAGRLRVTVDDEQGGRRAAGEVLPGETVGELEMLTGTARSATVEAVRDTELARVPRAGFERLAERYPRVLTRATRDVVGRLHEAFRRRAGGPTVTAMALVPLGPGVPLADFARRLSAALAEHGAMLHLDRGRLAELGGDRVARALAGETEDGWLGAWLNDLELDHRFVVYEAEATASPWTRRCLRQADRVLLVGQTGTDVAAAVESLDRWLGAGARTELVLLHADGAARAIGTREWLTRLPVAAHHHVRPGVAEDVRRLTRTLTGGAIGLVLGGGGARGFAHVGVLRALREAGLPVDAVGGTSMGALIAGCYALGMDHAAIVAQAKTLSSPRRLFDYTLPLVSLFTGRKLAATLQTLFGETRIEDLWRPFFCVSSSLSRAQPVVHRQGPLWFAVRASCSVAGIFAPVALDGDILVDGGYLNNLPIDVMRGLAGGMTVVAVNVNPPGDMLSDYDVEPSLSGWRVLRSRARPRGQPVRAPSIFATMLRASSLNGAYQLTTSQRLADLVINPPVAPFGILDFARYERVIEIGYDSARRQIEEWLATRSDACAPARSGRATDPSP